MQSEAIAIRPDHNVPRIAAVGAGYIGVTYALCWILKAPFADTGLVTWRPEVALGALLLSMLGFAYLPAVGLAILIESLRTPTLGANPGFVLVDLLSNGLVAVGIALIFRRFSYHVPWGSQRDFLVFGLTVFLVPLIPALSDYPFIKVETERHPVLLQWISVVAPLMALFPAGIKTWEWFSDEDRYSFQDFVAKGVSGVVLVGQAALLAVGSAFLWYERLQGGPGEVYPLFIGVFWVALSSGLVAAAYAVLLANLVVVSAIISTRASEAVNFDVQLAALVMGVGSLVAGVLVSARREAEDRLVDQSRALQRKLAETQIIRRITDSIIALQHESAIYELAAEAIGDQLKADEVRIFAIEGGASQAVECGSWRSETTRSPKVAADFTSQQFSALWDSLEADRRTILSTSAEQSAVLIRTRLDVALHGAAGIKSILIHPFSFEVGGFYAVAALSYQSVRSWQNADRDFLKAVADQITVALQKMRLLHEREERSREFARISQAVSSHTGEAFFRNLMLRLADAAGTLGAYLSEVDGEDKARVLAIAVDGKLRKEFTFQLEAMPSKVALHRGEIALPTGADKTFPALREVLADRVEGFAAIRISGSSGNPLGVLSVFDDKPLRDPEHLIAIMRVFAGRAAAEIERVHRERLLEESEASYRRILETAHEGIWLLDNEGRTGYVNPAMASMLGYAAEDMLGKPLADFVHSEQRSSVEIDLAKRLAGTAHREDFRFARRDGTSLWAMLSVTPILNDTGSFNGALVMATDIGERKKMEQELELRVEERTAELLASNRELEAFCYSISHDLRQPLRAIDGFSRAVVDDLGEAIPEESKDHLKRVRRAANRMSELIDALLTLSRLSRVEMRRESVDLTALAEAILADLARNDPNHPVEVTIWPGLKAMGDAKLLHIALENLLSNAWKFSSKVRRPCIEVGEAKIDGKTWFFVRDNGIGFDMAYSAKLFKPFERLHSDQEYFGTGIGLATVSRVIARHGGEIRAEGAVGRGATFWFRL